MGNKKHAFWTVLGGLIASLFLTATRIPAAEEDQVVLIGAAAPAASSGKNAACQVQLIKQHMQDVVLKTGETRATVGWYNGENRIWLNFDVSAIPKDAVLVSAVVRLWQNGIHGTPDGHRYDLCLLKKQVDPAHLTWKYAAQNIPWATGGASLYEGETADRSLPIATILCPGGQQVWRQWDVTEGLQAALKAGPFYGFLLLDRDVKQDDPQSTSVLFAVPESMEENHRPVLAVRWSNSPTEKTPAKSMRLPDPAPFVFESFQKFRDGQLPFDGYSLTRLAVISSDAPNTNSSSLTARGVVGAIEGGGETRVLLRFGGLRTSPFSIARAWIELHAPLQTGLPQMQLSRMTAAWLGAEVSWRERRWNEPWATPGGESVELRLPSSVILDKGSQVIRYDITEWATDWVKNPAANYGVQLRLNSGTVGLYSDNQETNELRPMLVIEYGPNR